MKGDYWFFIAVLIIIVGLALQQVTLFLVAFLFVLTGGASRLWNRFCLHRIEFHRNLSRNRVFFGEEVVYEIEVANRKLLPLPWLQIEDELPEQVTLLKGTTTPSHEGRVILNSMFPINWYHRIKRRYRMKCLQRGAFIFGPAKISSGDLFGLFRRERRYEKPDFLMVFPRLVPLDKLGIPSKQLFGDIRLKSHLFQDPVLTSGVRDYHFGDSMKRIHWKSSARQRRLQTKIYEPTTTVDISIFLDVRTVKTPHWGSVPQLLELAIITAAAISGHALDEGFRVGLHVNQLTLFSNGPVRVPHSQHADQLLHILEALSQLHQVESLPIGRFIRQQTGSLPWGSTLLVISAQPGDDLIATLLDLKRKGRSVALIKVGGEPLQTAGDNLAVYHVPDVMPWEVVDKVSIKSEQPRQSPAAEAGMRR
jgi:uncharacterized protein (DUF58 family)